LPSTKRTTSSSSASASKKDDASHQAFTQKYELPFALVADTDGSIAKRFGVPVNNGYAARMSFLIGKDGKIKKVYPKVDPSVHSAEILTDATS
jgi:thioredoxin-dependent peroxiredoxin